MSIKKIFKQATDTYAANFSPIMKRIWLPTLVLAIDIAVIFATFFAIISLEYPSRICGALFLLAIFAQIFLLPYVGTKLTASDKILSPKKQYNRLLKLTICITLIVALICALAWLLQRAVATTLSIPIAVALAVAAGLSILILLPTFALQADYATNPETSLLDVFRPKKIFHRFWKNLGIAFITLIIYALIALVFALPLIILLIAAIENQFSTFAYGDANGLNAYFLPLIAFAALIATFGACGTAAWAFFVAYYTHKDIASNS